MEPKKRGHAELDNVSNTAKSHLVGQDLQNHHLHESDIEYLETKKKFKIFASHGDVGKIYFCYERTLALLIIILHL